MAVGPSRAERAFGVGPHTAGGAAGSGLPRLSSFLLGWDAHGGRELCCAALELHACSIGIWVRGAQAASWAGCAHSRLTGRKCARAGARGDLRAFELGWGERFAGMQHSYSCVRNQRFSALLTRGGLDARSLGVLGRGSRDGSPPPLSSFLFSCVCFACSLTPAVSCVLFGTPALAPCPYGRAMLHASWRGNARSGVPLVLPATELHCFCCPD